MRSIGQRADIDEAPCAELLAVAVPNCVAPSETVTTELDSAVPLTVKCFVAGDSIRRGNSGIVGNSRNRRLRGSRRIDDHRQRT